MNWFPIPWAEFQPWLVRASGQAAVLALLILLVQTLLGKRLAPAWRYRLWLLVVIRLVLPFQAPSPTSVHNLTRLPSLSPVSPPPQPLVIPAPLPVITTPNSTAPVPPSNGEPTEPRSPTAVATRDIAAPPHVDTAPTDASKSPIPPSPSTGIAIGRMASWVWLLGVACLAIRIVVQNLRFRWRLKQDSMAVDSVVMSELEACRKLLAVRSPIQALETSHVQSPAVYGLLRPTLLLPRGLAAEFSPEQLRHVLLHEVAHVKRGDTVMTWVMAALQVLHWFNPILWFAFGRMRADRELACDALVLAHGRDGEATGYGETIIHLLEVMNRRPSMPGLVGILEDKHQIQERIRMIAAFRRPGRSSAFAVLLLVALGWVGLTDAASVSKPPPPVLPLRLTNLLVQSENQSWLNEPLWKATPRGSNVFGGIEFHLDGLIQLFGTGPERDGKNYRQRVVIPLVETNGTGPTAKVIQRGTNVGALHLVTGTAYDAPAGTRIADVIWRYTDGTFKRSPIQYGIHVRDWWRARYEEPARLPGPHVKVIWRGSHPDVTRWGKSMRFYRLSLANPEPKRAVRQLELVSANERPALLLLAMTLDSLAPGERPDHTPDLEEVDPEPTGHLMVTVQDDAGVPVPGAEIRVSVKEIGVQTGTVDTKKVFTTDVQGSADVLHPAVGIDRLQIVVSKEDYGPRKVIWDTTKGDAIPPSHTLKLRNAIRIGGTVVSPEGTPVEGATVTLNRYWRGGERMGDKGETAEFPRQEHTTGSDGRWTARNVPPDLMHRIGIQARHPDYIEARAMGEPDASTLAQLKEESHVLTLGRGLDVRGRVTDENDAPIAEATVWAGGRNYPDRQETKSDAEGRFVFRNVKEDRVLFSVLAKSYEPSTQTQKVSAEMPEIVFRLGPGNVIRARVVNAEGDPLPGTRVVLEGHGDIGRTYEFSTQTDDDGRFEWDSAPSEPMQFYFYSAGYEQKRNHPLLPAQDNVVVMERSRRIVGRVVDSESGDALPRFRLAVGRAFEGNLDNFYPDHPGLTEYSAPDGSFSLNLDEEETNAIQVEAEDHATAKELLPAAVEGEVHLTVALKPSPGLRGLVVDGAGRPVPGAHVTVTSAPSPDGFDRGNQPTLRAGRLTVRSSGTIVESDADGRFVFSSPPIEGSVIAVHEAGFASVPMDIARTSGRLVLQPYGRIEGVKMVLGQPVVGEGFLLDLTSMGLQTDFQAYRSVTDAQGRFVLERVPPGIVGLRNLVNLSPNSWMHGREVPVTVQPGQTSRVTLGNSGAVLQGQVRFEAPSGEENMVISGSLNTPQPPRPDNLTHEQAQAYFASPEWIEYMKTQKSYPVSVRPDGSLQLDSVDPGKYVLSITATVAGNQPWNSRKIASGSAPVTVPPDATPTTPIPIGEIVLKPVEAR